MKRLSSLQNKTYLGIWIAYHAVILAAFCAMLLSNRGTVKFDADLFNMLPKPVTAEAFAAADAKLTEMTGKNVFILVSNEQFSQAKAAAETVYAALNGSPRFKSVSLYQDTSNLGDITAFIQKYRWNLLDEETASLLNAPGGAELFAQNALATAYGAFTLMPLSVLETDPFLLSEHNLQNYLSYLQKSGTALSPKDGVLASFVNGKWYILIRAVLSEKGAALASGGNAVVQIYEVCTPLEKDGTRFVFSGTPFHSYKSSSAATKEISVITSVSMLVVLAILLLVFKRPQPIFCSLLSIFVSVLTAVAATFALFGKMHVLTLVFGTSLIGSCIDYSLHYFITWKGNSDFHSGREIRAHLLKGLGLSLISTVLCYFVLLFAPFTLLKQMSVFSMTGIVSAFLTAIALYPYIPVPETDRDIRLLRLMRTPSWYNKKVVGRIVITSMFVVSIGMLVVFHKHFKIENNVARLYKLEGRELSDEAEAAGVLNYSPSGWFIISGETEEDVLQKEEAVAAQLRTVNKGKTNGGYICTSAFIPSIKKQRESRAAAERLLPLAPEQYESLGYDKNCASALSREFYSGNDDFIRMGKNVPDSIEKSVSAVWLGNIDGTYYSVVIPTSVTDYDAYMKIVGDSDGVFFVSKVRSVNSDLDRLSKMLLMLFSAVYILIFIVLKLFYTWKQSFKIISVPLLIVLFVAAIFSAVHIHLEFFSIVGMILVFGLGLDYVIYMIENEKRSDKSDNAKLEPFAIALSFVTTAVSFGSLALSRFIPVHVIGLSIFIGLAVAYVSTFFYTRTEF